MEEKDILDLIHKDRWMMRVLRIAEKQNLPNWVIGAGFVRNKVWDHLHGYKNDQVDTPDIDLVYYDPNGNNEEEDRLLSKKLREQTGVKFEVINEVYTHEWHNYPPLGSIDETLYRWAETATGIGVRLKENRLELVAPHGVHDLVNLILRPSPGAPDGLEVMKMRMKKKKWLEKWPKLKVLES